MTKKLTHVSTPDKQLYTSWDKWEFYL